jgi:multicomponent Na+:H+ antiporter subunit D
VLAALFIVPAFSLAGFPPLSGFWAKYLIVKAAIELDAWLVAFVALLVGLLTIFSMTKIWAMAFWKPHPDGIDPVPGRVARAIRLPMMIPIVGLAAMTVVIGLIPEPFVAFAEVAAHQLLDPEAYVTTVLGVRP